MHLWSKLSNLKWEDAWQERFAGHPGLVISRIGSRPTIRVELYCATEAEAGQVQAMWGGSVRPVAEQNWMAQVLPRIEPIKIRDRLLVVSETDEESLTTHRRAHPGREIITIPVEMAFGTGDHATTSTMLRQLVDESRRRKPGWSLADVGCGTGLLAIAALKLGAARAEGFDFDPHAVAAATRNAKRNEVPASFKELDLRDWRPQQRYQVITANVFADVLSKSMPRLAAALEPTGTLLLSGILREHLGQVLAAVEAAGLHRHQHLACGKWQTLRLGVKPATS